MKLTKAQREALEIASKADENAKGYGAEHGTVYQSNQNAIINVPGSYHLCSHYIFAGTAKALVKLGYLTVARYDGQYHLTAAGLAALKASEQA